MSITRKMEGLEGRLREERQSAAILKTALERAIDDQAGRRDSCDTHEEILFDGTGVHSAPDQAEGASQALRQEELAEEAKDAMSSRRGAEEHAPLARARHSEAVEHASRAYNAHWQARQCTAAIKARMANIKICT